jgi:outer membrane protein assembly factor BamB
MLIHRKTAAILIAVLSIHFSALAQTPRATLYVTVKNAKGETRKGMEVSISDKKTSTTAPLRSFTDERGNCNFNVPRSVTYAIKVDGKAAGEVAIPATGGSSVTKSLVVEFSKPAVATAKMDTIKFAVGEELKANETEGIGIINVGNGDEGVKGVKITLVSTKINKAFVTYSGDDGAARMKLPLNNDYKIYTDGIEFGHTFNMPDIPYINKGLKIQYIPTHITETATGDTIIQNQNDITGATADRVYIYFTITEPNGTTLLANEPIYLNSTTGTKVYQATTNSAGRAKFLIPKDAVYSVNFKYERDVDLLDLTQNKGYRTIEIDYSYLGSANIEKFYDTAKRDKNGFLTEFMVSEVKPHTIHTNYLEKTATGYNLNLVDDASYSKEVSSSPPSVAGNNLFISGGYYSRYFYGFDKGTGKNLWGVELADGGASAAVSDSGVVLIITQSCTLYALDQIAGTPLWSKWLGSSMYSTPTVANGKVYAVYPDDLYTYGSDTKGDYVLVCFGLKKGDIQWQQRISGNVAGSPVYANGNVYLTNKTGMLYAFEGTKGKEIAKKQLNAISAPTVVGNNLVIATQKTTGVKELGMYNTTTLALVKKLPGSAPINKEGDGAITDMSNDEGRALCYKGKYYYVLKQTVYCADATGNTVWSKPIGADCNTMPVVAGGKIVVADDAGKVQLLSPADGSVAKTYNLGSPIFSQPVVNNGVIYAATKKGTMVSHKTGDTSLNGWAMWCGNAGHNTVVE